MRHNGGRAVRRSTASFLPGGFLWLLLAVPLSWSHASRADEVIYYHDWQQVRNALAMLQLPALQRVVRQYDASEQAIIVVRYPGGDDGNAWALELRDWLVALGISSEEIRLEPGSGIPQAIVVRAETAGSP